MSFALKRLRALRAEKDSIHTKVPEDWLEKFEERAAILEYDGGMDRKSAEAQALTEIYKRIETKA